MSKWTFSSCHLVKYKRQIWWVDGWYKHLGFKLNELNEKPAFLKLCFRVVDGTCNRRNKAAFSDLSGVVKTGPQTGLENSRNNPSRVIAYHAALPAIVKYQFYFNQWATWTGKLLERTHEVLIFKSGSAAAYQQDAWLDSFVLRRRNSWDSFLQHQRIPTKRKAILNGANDYLKIRLWSRDKQ